jgi:hypothetical protein
MRGLGEQTKAMAGSVTTLLRTVQGVEDEKSRVVTALGSAIEAIASEARSVVVTLFM